MKATVTEQLTVAQRILRGSVRGACVFFAALLLTGLAQQVPALRAQTPTPVPTYFYDWTGAADDNFLNPLNWKLTNPDGSTLAGPSAAPEGPTAAIRLPGDTTIPNKNIRYDYTGTGDKRLTFYSIQTGMSNLVSMYFKGTENGWIELNPIGKGFTYNGIIDAHTSALSITNPNGTGGSGYRNSFRITLDSYSRVVLDGAYTSMRRDESGLAAGSFTLLGNASIDISKANENTFIRPNGEAFNSTSTVQIGALQYTDPGTVVYGGTLAINLNAKVPGGLPAEMRGLVHFAATATASSILWGNMTVMSGTVISPGIWRVRDVNTQYIVDGRHDGPITATNRPTGGGTLGGRGVVNVVTSGSDRVIIEKGAHLTAAARGTAPDRSQGEQFTINGNVDIRPGGILDLDLVSETHYDYIVINGNLDIVASPDSPDNPNLSIGRADTFPLAPGTYTLLTVNGNINGEFLPAHVSLPISLSLASSWRWNGNNLEVSFEQLPFASDPELTGMYRIVAERIDQIANAGVVSDVLFDTLNRQPSSILFKNVLYQLSPSTYQAWYPGAIFRTNSMVQNIDDMQFQDAAYKRKKGTWQTFLQGYRLEASRDRNEMAAYSNYGTIASIAGADYAFGENFVAGGFIAYEQSDFDLDTEGGESNANSYTFGLKARYNTGKFQLNATAFYGTDDYDAERTVAATRLATWADADTKGTRLGAAVTVAYTFNHPWFEIAPTAGVQWLSWQADAFQERNANEASLYVYEQKETTLQSKLGVRIARSFETKHGHIRPFFQYAWIHEYDNGTRTLSANLFGDDGRIDIEAPGSNANGYRIDFGLDWNATRSLRIDLRYTGEYKTAVDESRGIRGGVTWTF